MLSRAILRKARLINRELAPYSSASFHLRSFCTESTSGDLQDNNKTTDVEGAGRDLAKLSKLVQVLREEIRKDAATGLNTPQLLLQLEEETNEAFDIIKRALDKSGRPCTVEELADRIDKNIVLVPREALGYRDYLRAHQLRDQIEMSLVDLNVMPPLSAMIEEAKKPHIKAREEAERELLKSQQKAQENMIQAGIESKEPVLTELRPVTEEQLALRKAYMEQSTKMEYILRGYETALLEVGRVHKVVKGGTTMSMRALVVIGNKQGVAGYGEGKSDTAAHAIERACRDAKRNLLFVDRFQDRTINHRVMGKYVKSQVALWPAPRGTGISANNNFSAVFQLFGIKDIGAKLHGPRCLSNSVKALFNALSQIRTEQSVLHARGLQELPLPPPRPTPGIRRRKFRAL